MRYPDAQQFKIDAGNSRVFLPKLGWIRYRNSRELLGTAKTITVASNGGKWFVSIQTEREVAESVPLSASIIGVGVGVGVGITRIANVRRDFRHKTSTTIGQKPRDGVHRGLAGTQPVQVSGRQQPSARAQGQGPSRASTSRFWIKAGSSFAGNCNASRPGEAARCWRFGRAIPARRALAAARCRHRIARPMAGSPVRHGAMRTTPMSSVRSMSWRQDMPRWPVEEGCGRAVRPSTNPPKRRLRGLALA